jgi:PD-(D/E)XK endonuclease
MFGFMNPREQGDFGEWSAAHWLAWQGAAVYIPFGHSPDVDLVADLDGRLARVQVKTSTCRSKRERWAVTLCTRGGNQSWNGLVKRLDASRCDYLFVHVGDGRRWFIPTAALECHSGLTLGGPKYAEFEVEPGAPIPTHRAAA